MQLTYSIPESKKDITVNQYLKIQQLYKQAEELEIDVDEKQLISICINKPVAIVDKIPFEHYNQAIKVIAQALNKETTLHLTFDLKGVKYGFINDLENMSAGEYAALDQLLKDTDKNACDILNVLYRPIVKEKFYKSWFNKKERGRYVIEPYNSNNDVSVFQDAPFEVYESALVFFYNLGKELIKGIQNFMKVELESMTKEQRDLAKNGDGFKHLTLTLHQSVLELKKSNINLSTKYYLD